MQALPTYRRLKIVEAVDAGGTVATVAKRFAVSETTVRNYLKLREQGSLEPKPPSGGRKPTLSDKDRKRLLDAVDKRPDATLAELGEECRLGVSESTVCRELQKLDRPRKRKVPRAAEQDEARIRRERTAWVGQTDGVDPHRLIFVDETATATNMTRRHGRAPQGERVYTNVPYRNYKTLTVLGGMRLDGAGALPTMVYAGGTTTDRMVEYVTGPLRDVLKPNDIVVADKLTAHRANRVSETLAEQGAEIWLLPSYSPDLNPIERLWSKIKEILRAAKAKTVDHLKAALEAALEDVTNSDINNWFAHSNYLPSTP